MSRSRPIEASTACSDPSSAPVGCPGIRAVRLFVVQLERSVSALVEKALRAGVMNVRLRVVDGARVEVSSERAGAAILPVFSVNYFCR